MLNAQEMNTSKKHNVPPPLPPKSRVTPPPIPSKSRVIPPPIPSKSRVIPPPIPSKSRVINAPSRQHMTQSKVSIIMYVCVCVHVCS